MTSPNSRTLYSLLLLASFPALAGEGMSGVGTQVYYDELPKGGVYSVNPVRKNDTTLNHQTGLPYGLMVNKEAEYSATLIQHNKRIAPIIYRENILRGAAGSQFTSETTIDYLNNFGYNPR